MSPASYFSLYENISSKHKQRVGAIGHNQHFHLSICCSPLAPSLFLFFLFFYCALMRSVPSLSQCPLLHICFCEWAWPCVGEGRDCIIFTALTEHHIDKSPIVFLFPASLPLCFFPRFSPFSHSLYSLLSSHNVRYIHIQHLTSLCVSPSLSLFLLGIKSYHHFPALFRSFFPSLSPFMTSSNPLSLSDNSEVLLWSGPNFRTAIPFCLCPSHLAFFFFLSLPQCCSGYRDVPLWKESIPQWFH